MAVPVIYLDEHEVNKVAGMLAEISSLEEQKEGLEKKKEEASNTLNDYVVKLFTGSNEEYEKKWKEWEIWEKSRGQDLRWEPTVDVDRPPPSPTISDDKRSLVLLPDEKDGQVPIVRLSEEESKRIAGLLGEVRSLGGQAKLASQHAGIKKRELLLYVRVIAMEKSELYQDYRKEIDSGRPSSRDIRPILTDDGKAIVIRNWP